MASSVSLLKRGFASSGALQNTIKHVTVIGGGLMGSGIAQVTAQSGTNVTIVEINEEALKKAEASISTSIQRVAKKVCKDNAADAETFVKNALSKLKLSTDLKQTVADTDLVIEAIVENMGAKHKLFSAIDDMAPQKTIFASNTSSLPIAEIASVTKRKDRFGGLHFFNPVPVMKLLEVIRIPETSEETYQTMMNWGKSVGKTCVTCKDTPGFVVNRLLVPNLAEAVRMLERGDATARDIDTAMKLGAGYPMGPFELADYVGLDTTKFILDGWHARFPDNELFKPIATLTKLVNEGKCGIKSGEGFYSYKKNKIVSAQSGNKVVIVDVSDEALKKTSQIIEKSLGRVAKTVHKDNPEKSQQFLANTLANVTYSKNVVTAVSGTDLVIEAIVENLASKHKVFKALDEAAPPHALLTSNTSSLSIKEITEVVSRKDKCGGLHFFNPVPMMKLLEVVRIPETSDDSYTKMMEWGKSIGKVCVTCKDTPGFVVNRLLVSVLTEAARMLERGDATARDIDTAMKLGCGHPMGPLELCDYVGLDTQKFVLDGWHEKFPDNPLFEPIGILNKLVAEGKFGMKTGEGYYSYKKK